MGPFIMVDDRVINLGTARVIHWVPKEELVEIWNHNGERCRITKEEGAAELWAEMEKLCDVKIIKGKRR